MRHDDGQRAARCDHQTPPAGLCRRIGDFGFNIFGRAEHERALVIDAAGEDDARQRCAGAIQLWPVHAVVPAQRVHRIRGKALEVEFAAMNMHDRQGGSLVQRLRNGPVERSVERVVRSVFQNAAAGVFDAEEDAVGARFECGESKSAVVCAIVCKPAASAAGASRR